MFLNTTLNGLVFFYFSCSSLFFAYRNIDFCKSILQCVHLLYPFIVSKLLSRVFRVSMNIVTANSDSSFSEVLLQIVKLLFQCEFLFFFLPGCCGRDFQTTLNNEWWKWEALPCAWSEGRLSVLSLKVEYVDLGVCCKWPLLSRGTFYYYFVILLRFFYNE